ncbi:hypothetical protein G7054_g252 [Neopestalotiopsis clavispora]|nr:hypothetical protein G7054_g252 [Neopestalotiopsis clavispora]
MARSLTQDPSALSGPLCLVEHDSPSEVSIQDGSVHLKFLASPVNRVDLMVLSGLYPVKPQYDQNGHPVPGFDGCGVVKHSKSPDLSPGDIVIPRELGLGTWRSDAVLPATSLIKLPSSTPPLAGALLRSGALIAWLLLETIRPLKDGDTIIVSAGTSSVASFIVQLSRLKRVSVVLVIRDRSAQALSFAKEQLTALGANVVLSESELAEGTIPLPSPPVLALDSVYGRVGQLLADALAPKGTFVLVGLLSGPKSSINVTIAHLFSKQLSFVPFRGSEVLKAMGEEKAASLITDVAELFVESKIKVPDLTLVKWRAAGSENLETILQESLERAKGDEIGTKKTVWVF